jgi:predicted RNA-binding Zn-ribbon protein involved in translation (DUF1610 family)
MRADSALDRIGECPECKGILTPQTISLGPFNCPYCGKYIRPVRRRSYLWLRVVICGVIAVATAKLTGWDWSFLIFVVSFYALPMLVLWDTIVFRLFPPTKFEAVASQFQTLGIK